MVLDGLLEYRNSFYFFNEIFNDRINFVLFNDWPENSWLIKNTRILVGLSLAFGSTSILIVLFCSGFDGIAFKRLIYGITLWHFFQINFAITVLLWFSEMGFDTICDAGSFSGSAIELYLFSIMFRVGLKVLPVQWVRKAIWMSFLVIEWTISS